MMYSAENLRGLSSLISRIKTKTFSIDTQYKFLKLLKVAKEEESYVDEQQVFLLENYAEKNEQGQFIMSQDGGFKIKQECLSECTQKILEINNRQVQLPDLYFSLDELAQLELTLEELELLEPFIK